ncbi:cupin domain-containing protein [Sphaerochaeta sp. PS]|uniref:cupin domain-containing protein n=1 Tax=Sphaerochaeta sp. PS TaxID=3076336 RepID=UPI0028A523F6|nr:cupin domain-containing protein [Sphaerochaeta sp. PS]MDT4763019.1 cupin domain-containing protein [Sphaerochaeta sp. PS]
MAVLEEEVRHLIQKLGLERLEGEGGYFRKYYTHRSGSAILGGTIYYLVTEDSFSSLHWLPTDELWYFLQGSRLEQLVLYPDGRHSLTLLGPVGEAVAPLSLVPGGCYQGTRLLEGGYALCATTMCPPYDPDRYVQGTKALLDDYPTCTRLVDFLREEDR